MYSIHGDKEMYHVKVATIQAIGFYEYYLIYTCQCLDIKLCLLVINNLCYIYGIIFLCEINVILCLDFPFHVDTIL